MDNAALHAAAHKAGQAAAEALVPRPMMVVGGGQRWHVPEGVCGFAWVIVRPGTSPYARWMRKALGTRKAYEGGEELWIRDYNQSYERKIAYARAYAEVLQKSGINATAGGRLD